MTLPDSDSMVRTSREGPQTALYAHSLIYGFVFHADGSSRELTSDDLSNALGQSDDFVWLHFNAANARTREWLQQSHQLPPKVAEFLLDADERQRIESMPAGVTGLISDLCYDFHSDPDEIATLRFHLDSRHLITTRRSPLNATDQLRKAIREGLLCRSSPALLVELFRLQAGIQSKLAAHLGQELGRMEDEILSGRIEDQRAELGKIRRLAVRLHRHFSPENRALRRLVAHPPGWFSEADIAELRDTVEDFGVTVDELDAIQDRAKMLQEELVGRVAEETNHNLIVLSIVTAVLLPVTLITGIFGMNVAGLPGVQDASAFAWVIAAMIVTAIITILILHWNRLF
jgi:zinc transporter